MHDEMLEMERKLWGPPLFFFCKNATFENVCKRHTYFLFLAKKEEISKRLEPQLANAYKKIDL